MASRASDRNVVVRAAAILTTAEVAGGNVDLNDAAGSDAAVEIDFTIGSLTNVVVRFYVSNDNVTFKPLFGPSGAALTQTVTATGVSVIPIKAPGYPILRVSAQGTGTVTSSSLTLTVRYDRRGSQ